MSIKRKIGDRETNIKRFCFKVIILSAISLFMASCDSNHSGSNYSESCVERKKGFIADKYNIEYSNIVNLDEAWSHHSYIVKKGNAVYYVEVSKVFGGMTINYKINDKRQLFPRKSLKGDNTK